MVIFYLIFYNLTNQKTDSDIRLFHFSKDMQSEIDFRDIPKSRW